MKKAMICCALASWPLTGLAQDGDEKAPAFVPIDFSKVERRITKEPPYVSQPLYALFIFGPRGQARSWAVLDRSKKDLGYHDVLYFDRNANGDLTDPGERFTGTYDERGARAGMAVVIRIGDYTVPGSQIEHTSLRVSTVRKASRTGIYFSMMWRGKERVSGGAGPSGTNCTAWAPSPASAPILRPTIQGPLAFAFYYGNRLKIGASTRLSLIIGNPGSGPDTLCTLSDEFLDRTRDEISARLIARDERDREVIVECVNLAPC